MPDIKEILERASLDNMIALLLDEPEPVNGKIEISDKAIEESYREFIAELGRLYPELDKDSDKLFDTILKFATIHEEIYFKAGLITGIRMERNFEEEEKRIMKLKVDK